MKTYPYPIELSFFNQPQPVLSVSENTQIFWVSSGTLTLRIYEASTKQFQTYRINSDELFLLNKFSLYTIEPVSAYEAFCFSVFENRFKACISELFSEYFMLKISDTIHIFQLKQYLSRYALCFFKATDASTMLCEALSIQIMSHLIEYFSVENQKKSELSSSDKHQRIVDICRYINLHYTKHLTMDTLAAAFFITPQYLSKLFRDLLHISPFEYIQQVRLSHAVFMLQTTSESLEYIAEVCGFANARSMAHIFQNTMHMLPGVYRKQHNTSPQSGLNTGSTLDTRQALFQKYAASGTFHIPEFQKQTKKTIAAPVQLSTAGTCWKHHYLHTLFLSDARFLLYEQYQRQLKEAHHDFHFTYVHIQTLLSDEMHIYYEDSDGISHMNYADVDNVLDFLYHLGIFPHIIIDNPPTLLIAKGKVSTIEDISKWQFFLSSFIAHCEFRYGKDYVSFWRIGVGIYLNNPSWKYYRSFDELVDFYQTTYRILRTCNPSIRIGSPYFLSNFELPDNELFHFLDQCQLTNTFPDFICLNHHPVTFSHGFELADTQQIFSENPDELSEYLTNFIHLLKKHYSVSIPVLLMSWDFYVGYNYLNDTLYRAVYALKNILDAKDIPVEFCTYSLSDLMGGTPTSTPFFPGGIGLFTLQDMKKPIYYMYQLLRQLGSLYVASGNHYFIARTENSFQIILYHYIHYHNKTAEKNTFDITYQNRYTAFNGASDMEITIPLFCDFATEFYIRETVINHDHGSIYDAWENSGFISLEQQDSINFIHSVSVPFTSSQSENFSNCFYLTRTLQPLEIRLIQLSWH